MARLQPEEFSFRKETDRLLSLLDSIAALSPSHKKIIAEIVLLRLAILIENHLKLIFCKIACSAVYLDGTHPRLIAAQRSIQSALSAMMTLNRPKQRYAIWNDGAEIRENVKHVIDPIDSSITVMRNHASYLTDIRYIRNHIAHRNDGSRRNFQTIVRRYYGAHAPAVTCGTLLLSTRASVPSLIEVHVRTSRVLIKDLVRA
jgi:hypothetical protein